MVSLPSSRVFEIDCALHYELEDTTDFLFQIHVLRGMGQQLRHEVLSVDPAADLHVYADPHLGHRFLRFQANKGDIHLNYHARVEVATPECGMDADELPVSQLPDHVLHNLMPTRYCESDLLARAAWKLFGDVSPGIQRVQAITDWLYDNLDYERGSTQSTTTACDVFLSRTGVCRDFSHLAVAFCRALNIPARLVAAYAIFDEPPADFHAVFEAYIGHRWVMFDPTRLAAPNNIVRIAQGRDAKDVAFATLFGPATLVSMDPHIECVGQAGVVD